MNFLAAKKGEIKERLLQKQLKDILISRREHHLNFFIVFQLLFLRRRDGRAVECGGLENR